MNEMLKEKPRITNDEEASISQDKVAVLKVNRSIGNKSTLSQPLEGFETLQGLKLSLLDDILIGITTPFRCIFHCISF
jgi:hypothetical protein